MSGDGRDCRRAYPQDIVLLPHCRSSVTILEQSGLRKTGQHFGAHMSIAGGLYRAFEAADAAGCDCVQVFVKNQRQWQSKPLDAEQVRLWRAARLKTGISSVVAHATYLANLGSTDEAIWSKSVAAVVDELERCHVLEIPYLVLHPGAHVNASLARGIRRVIKGIDTICRRTVGVDTSLLLETTAGQGRSIGHRFEHLQAILTSVREPERLGVCLDTCHLFAAGYALSPQADYAVTMQALDTSVGLGRVRCIHLNDSKRAQGSRVDRHEHIGKGLIGLKGFRPLLNDARLWHIPRILETPKGRDDRGRDLDQVNLARVRRLVRGVSPEFGRQ